MTVLGVGCAAVLVADEDGAPTVLAGSDDTARALLGIEAATGAGPAIDCTRAGRAQSVIVDAARDRWPPWAEAAGRGGWRTAAAVPLRTRERTVGGLVLLRAAGSVCPGDDALAQAHALASVAACALVQYRERCRLQLRSDQLQAALTTRVAIEQAKGVLAERGGIDVQAAFDRLRAYARAHRQPLADVARDVVTGELADAVLTQVPPLRRRPPVADPRSPA
jgi:ANTAR domain/GAF domain